MKVESGKLKVESGNAKRASEAGGAKRNSFPRSDKALDKNGVLKKPKAFWGKEELA